jgi:predicted ribosome quality control (RQC) complex YloA/Tae2 family protein
MPFDNFVTGAIAAELDGALAEGRIERVYQPERYEIILHLNVPPRGRNGGEDRRHHDLLISAHGSQPYLYLSGKKSGNPQTPPAFCMLLRKHLIGARIERVRRVGRERIIRMDIGASDELGLHRRRALLFEIMGKHSNIILLDENDVVIDAIKRIYAEKETQGSPGRVRTMLPGAAYALPPPGKGIGPLMEAETGTGRPLSYYEALDDAGRYEPFIFTDEAGHMKDYYVFDIALYGGLGRVRLPSVSAMLESYYEERESDNRIGQKCADLRQIVKNRLDKLYLKKQRLLEDREKAKRAEEYRMKGELITANIYRLKQGMSEAELETFASMAAAPEGETDARAPGETKTVRVALDPLLTPAQNAQKYFKKYAKAGTALTEKTKQIELTERDIAFLESYKVFMENAVDAADIDRLREELTELGYVKNRPKKTAKSAVKKEYLRYESSAGLSVYVGRSGKENDELTMRKAKPDDLWLHTKDIPGSHVVLERAADAARGGTSAPVDAAGGAPPGFDEDSLREAAQIASYYSKARQSESVPVDYCLIKYVKKPSGAKPGFVIFTHNKTLYVKPALPPT